MFYAFQMVEYLVFCEEHNVFLLLKKRTYPRILHAVSEGVLDAISLIHVLVLLGSPEAENFDIFIRLNHIFT